MFFRAGFCYKVKRGDFASVELFRKASEALALNPNARLYFDYNARAPLRPSARAALLSCLDQMGNPSSVHTEGRTAFACLEAARFQIAQLVGAEPAGVFFTSGATESNVWALSPLYQEAEGQICVFERVVMSAIEHPSVQKGGGFAAEHRLRVPVTSAGVLDLDGLESILKQEKEGGRRSLISVMMVNNETGVLQPLRAVGELACLYGAFLHVDATQAVGRIEVPYWAWGVDALSVSAHKMGGPPGIGALILRNSERGPLPLLRGGNQETRRRAGTENTPAIAGFGAVAQEISEIGMHEEQERLQKLRAILEEGLSTRFEDLLIFGKEVPRISNTSCFAIPGVPSETAAMALDLAGIAVSPGGAACASGKISAGHVLEAMGVPLEYRRCALRVSLGWATQEEEVLQFLERAFPCLARILAYS